MGPRSPQVNPSTGERGQRRRRYRGRTAVHELLVIDEAMRRAIIDGRDAGELDALAMQSGMRSLYHDGLRKVSAGVTTLEEVMRVAQELADG